MVLNDGWIGQPTHLVINLLAVPSRKRRPVPPSNSAAPGLGQFDDAIRPNMKPPTVAALVLKA